MEYLYIDLASFGTLAYASTWRPMDMMGTFTYTTSYVGKNGACSLHVNGVMEERYYRCVKLCSFFTLFVVPHEH